MFLATNAECIDHPEYSSRPAAHDHSISNWSFELLTPHSAPPTFYTEIKFGLWDKILSKPAPNKELLYLSGVWHFAQGMALTAQGKMQPAAQELEKLQAIAADSALAKVTLWDINTTGHLLQIATEVLAGKLEAKQGNYAAAIAHLQKGVELEDSLRYDEPAPWYAPVRQTLGSVLLQANRPAEAEQAYREDLKIYPNNGWPLYGLMQSLWAQHKMKEAQTVQHQLDQAWKYADVRPDLASL